jgi:hypothetical protein
LCALRLRGLRGGRSSEALRRRKSALFSLFFFFFSRFLPSRSFRCFVAQYTVYSLCSVSSEGEKQRENPRLDRLAPSLVPTSTSACRQQPPVRLIPPLWRLVQPVKTAISPCPLLIAFSPLFVHPHFVVRLPPRGRPLKDNRRHRRAVRQ